MPQHKSGGKVSKKLKKFPRISDYLERDHPAVYQLLVDSGMIGNLTPKRGTGRTFLLPDASLIKQIRKLLDGTGDDPEKATEILGSLIVKDYLPTTKDWIAKKDDIPNVMGKKVQVKSSTGDKVELVAGTIEVDKKYMPLSRQARAPRGNTAVWKLKGHVPHDAKVPDATGKYIRKGAKVQGAFEFTANEDISLRELTRRIIADVKKSDSHPFEEALAGLLGVCKNDELCKLWVCMNLAHGPVAAYFLVFQPGCDEKYRVLNEQVGEFLNSGFTSPGPNAPRQLLEVWRNMPVNEEAMKERFDQLDSAMESKNAVSVLEQTYKNLAKDNMIGDAKNVIPDVLMDRLKDMFTEEERAKFLAGNDEFGFRIETKMLNAGDEINDKIKALNEIAEMCGNVVYQKPVLSSTQFLSNLIKPNQLYLSGHLTFMRSSHCINILSNPEAIKKMGDYDDSEEHPLAGGDINRASRIIGSMEKAASIKGGDVGVPSCLIHCLKEYVRDDRLNPDMTLKELIGSD